MWHCCFNTSTTLVNWREREERMEGKRRQRLAEGRMEEKRRKRQIKGIGEKEGERRQ